jgi:beta-N-acetylhexosaminidase
MDISSMTPEQLAGQRLMIGFEGSALSADLKSAIETYQVGGLILFAGNIVSPPQLASLCRSAQSFARSIGLPPLFIAIDQEGGEVARLKPPFSQFPGNPSMTSLQDAVRFAEVTASELLTAGVNMNMAPVLDVAPKNSDSIMANRIFGNDPEWVSDMGVAVIEHLQKKKVMAVAKHFPGIGRTTVDSHIDLPHMTAPLESIEDFDLIPFRAAIEHQVSAVMLSHISYPEIDDRWPASLSKRIALDLLRSQMGYRGVVMTDDLDMGAIKKYYPIEQVIERIVEANIDIALICHQGPDISHGFRAFVHLLSGSTERMTMGRESVKRIFSLKQQYLGTAC